MTTQVKICGLSTPDTLDAAIAHGASHVGFVFFARSPRNLTPERAAGLASRVPGRVARVGVFVDPDDALLDAAIAAIDIVQLHGSETPVRLTEIRARWGKPVWRAAGVASAADIRAASLTAHGAALLLLDAKAPSSAPLPGGNGLRFDWRVLGGARPGMAWGLSGGLDADNVGEAIRIAGPGLVDVSSGVEDAPGVKSVAKIRAFLETVRTI
ncbi:phosphoribosylanthranilate isomerase [Glacieibacterium frigidum]|uniref:phosphoribosylanthranilate isomerase n=1 Tax=Glacieibacterium frigidum TaxID=2593303 RepID=UPI00163D9F8E